MGPDARRSPERDEPIAWARVLHEWAGRLRHAVAVLVRALRLGYRSGVTGLAAMVAFNLLLALFPLAMLALFVWGRLLESTALEASALADLRRMFPSANDSSLAAALAQLRASSPALGVVGGIGVVWASMSFWSSLDTAFCRIYPRPCRSWLAQKRLALLMVAATVAFVTVTVALPALQSITVHGAERLPFGLSRLSQVAFVVSLLLGHAVLLILLGLVYWLIPNGRVPFAAVWPGALAGTLLSAAIGIAFPIYLTRVSSLAELQGSIAFAFVSLIWFYAQALALLAGAVTNAVRLDPVQAAARADGP